MACHLATNLQIILAYPSAWDVRCSLQLLASPVSRLADVEATKTDFSMSYGCKLAATLMYLGNRSTARLAVLNLPTESTDALDRKNFALFQMVIQKLIPTTLILDTSSCST